MRTPGGKVVRGPWGRSLVGSSLSGPFPAADVAVLVCCTALGLVVMRLNPKPSCYASSAIRHV
jgi:hypothetical protein